VAKITVLTAEMWVEKDGVFIIMLTFVWTNHTIRQYEPQIKDLEQV
jgi:hypothetical protein